MTDDKNEHYVVEVNIKWVHREPDGTKTYDSGRRQEVPTLGERQVDTVFHMNQMASTLEGAVVSAQKHLDVIVGTE